MSPKEVASSEKPTVVIIWNDALGMIKVSAYGDNVVGYRTPRIARSSSAIDNAEQEFNCLPKKKLSCSEKPNSRTTLKRARRGLRTVIEACR
jgi:hypothetical protein